MIKAVTLFSGYDSQCLGLDRLKEQFSFDYELIGWSEIDKYAIQAHNALYPQYAERNYGDVSKIEWDKVSDFDLLTYSSPCQDFSVAGNQKGGVKGSGTRSSLLWECERVIEAKRPKYLLMENVAALVSKKFIKLFNKWQFTLNEYGYTNYAKVLNAKDYGVPQNRERIFMVSVRNDINQRFFFPKPFILERRLKDVLEDNVDERFYLSDKSIKGFMKHNERHLKKGTGFLFSPKSGENIASCLRAKAALAATDNAIMEPKLRIQQATKQGYIKVNPYGVFDASYPNSKTRRGRVQDNGKVSPTLLCSNLLCLNEPTIAAMIGRNPDNPSDRRKNIHCEQRLEVGDTISNTLTSVQKDNLLIEPSVKSVGNVNPNNGEGIKFINPSEKQANRVLSRTSKISQTLSSMRGGNTQPKIIAPICVNSKVNGKQPSLADRIYDENGISTACTTAFRPSIFGNSRIRRLTPREYFRLMDVSDSDIDKLLSSGISNSQLYKLAGNSIVVSCLFHIFRKLFIETYNDDKQLELF